MTDPRVMRLYGLSMQFGSIRRSITPAHMARRAPRPISPAGSALGRPRRSEQGYIMIIFLLLLTMMIIALTAAAPRLAQQIKREREIEMIHRGDQYARAIKRYYKKFGRYPGRIEDLENTNTLRFLRKRYTDPITGGPWRLVRYGEIQMQGAGGVGTPAALRGQAGGAQPGMPQAGSPQAGSSGMFNLNFGGSSGQQNQAGAAGAMASGASAGTAAPGGTPDAANTPNTGTTADTSSGATGTAGQSTSLFGQTGTAAPGQTTSASSGSLFSSPATSAQPGMAGGAPIIGVASLSKANGIHEFNKKPAYKDWLFVYDPGQDRGQLLRGPYNPQAFFGQAGAPAGLTPAGATPAGAQGQQSPFGGSGIFGGSSSFGGQGAPGTPSPSPATPSPTPNPGQQPGGIVPSTQ